MNGDYKIDKDTFMAMDQGKQLWMMFKTFNAYRDESETRFGKLEKRKRFDTAVSGGSGLIGGFMAVLASKIWWMK